MYQINNLFDNSNIVCTASLGKFSVYEHQKDLSVSATNAETAFFSSEMNVRRKQVLVKLENNGCLMQAGAMQWTLGNISMTSGVNVGNFLGKAIGSAVTGETLSKPEYVGNGYINFSNK